MKKKFKSGFPIIAITAAIAACLILTGIILANHLNRDTAATVKSSDYIQNAYITSSSGGKICYLCDGESCEYDGTLSSYYTGIADIVFEDGKMVKIYTKSSSVSGTLLSYTDDSLRISGYGFCSRAEEISCYVMQSDDTVASGDFSDCTVGLTEAEFIFENGSVCAVIVSDSDTITTINVLLKNGDLIYYDSVYLTADSEIAISAYDTSGDTAESSSQDGESSDSSDDSGSAADDNSGDAGSDISAISCASGEIISASSVIAELYQSKSTGSSNSDAQSAAAEYSGIINECEISCADGLLYFCDSDGNIISEGYEGSFHIMQTEDGYVVVNTLPLEDYVRYVLPSEMPASFSYEALKAQAVCARTFACAQIKNSSYAKYGANLDDSTSYQVYNASGSNETMDQAAADTAGEVLSCDGKLITCYYYSTSPGFTTTTSVWDSESSPSYLTRTNCLINQETESDGSNNSSYTDGSGNNGSADYDLSDESVLASFLLSSPASYDSDSPFYRWTAIVNLADITDDSLGTLTSIKVISRNESGYVTEMECRYENGSLTLTNENAIRKLLGAGLTSLTLTDGTTRDFSTIPSACFCITEADGTILTLSGGGFGHGVGMSQYGADAMGDAGWSYEEILSFYYSGASISAM